MTALRTAAQQALEAMCSAKLCEFNSMSSRQEQLRLMDAAITTLKTALAEPVELVADVAKNATAQFDHAIGADRFKVVRGAFWWHVLIGDSTKEHGKFGSRAGAEQMAADLLREFRNGAFVQYTAPPQRPPLTDEEMKRVCVEAWSFDPYEIARAIERAHGIF